MPDTPKPRFDPTFTFGSLLQLLGMAVLGLSFLFAVRSDANQTARDVQELRQTVASQAITTRDSIRESMQRVEQNLSGINSQIQTLPPMSERLRRTEEDISRLQEADASMNQRIESRRNALDQRFDALQRQVIENTTRLEALSRASATNLPGSPGVRR